MNYYQDIGQSLAVKNESPNFNALSVRIILLGPDSVQESAVRREARSVNFGVIAFDQSDFVRCLVRQVVPLVIGVVLDGERAYVAIA